MDCTFHQHDQWKTEKSPSCKFSLGGKFNLASTKGPNTTRECSASRCNADAGQKKLLSSEQICFGVSYYPGCVVSHMPLRKTHLPGRREHSTLVCLMQSLQSYCCRSLTTLPGNVPCNNQLFPPAATDSACVVEILLDKSHLGHCPHATPRSPTPIIHTCLIDLPATFFPTHATLAAALGGSWHQKLTRSEFSVLLTRICFQRKRTFQADPRDASVGLPRYSLDSCFLSPTDAHQRNGVSRHGSRLRRSSFKPKMKANFWSDRFVSSPQCSGFHPLQLNEIRSFPTYRLNCHESSFRCSLPFSLTPHPGQVSPH